MKKLKQIWRYYFNVEIRLLKRLRYALIAEHNTRHLGGICETIRTFNSVYRTYYFNQKERNILFRILEENISNKNFKNEYLFPKGELQPRLDWCDMVINKIMVK